jgi:hypothetical protein
MDAGEGSAPSRFDRVPGRRLAELPGRTARAVRRAARRDPEASGLPAARPDARFVGAVLMDELVLSLVSGPGRLPEGEELDRVARELEATHAHLDAQGLLADPAGYHPAPPPAIPSIRSRSVRGVAHQHLRWHSGHRPHPDHPGTARWLAAERNRTAHAAVLRSPDPEAPWLVCLHGLGTGIPTADFRAFRAPDVREWLGINVVLPVLPRHGPRRIRRTSIDEFLSHDLVAALLGVSQAAWDIRSLLGWIRQQPGGDRIALHGISLGGYMTGLVAGLEEVDVAIAGVPVVDIPALFEAHVPDDLRPQAATRGLLGPMTSEVFSVVSPLTFPARVPHDGRAVYGGLGDRMSTPEQAVALWQHWEEPAACWFQGNHVASMFHRQVRSFVGSRLRAFAGVT